MTLQRRTPLKSGGRLRARSTKRSRWEADYQRVRPRVMARNGGMCERCGVQRSTVCHHKAGRQHPDANGLHNLAALCDPCHRHCHAHPEESYRDGWLIHYEQASA